MFSAFSTVFLRHILQNNTSKRECITTNTAHLKVHSKRIFREDEYRDEKSMKREIQQKRFLMDNKENIYIYICVC